MVDEKQSQELIRFTNRQKGITTVTDVEHINFIQEIQRHPVIN